LLILGSGVFGHQQIYVAFSVPNIFKEYLDYRNQNDGNQYKFGTETITLFFNRRLCV
jgi:hypothetical protein